jgi:BED zinc finger
VRIESFFATVIEFNRFGAMQSQDSDLDEEEAQEENIKTKQKKTSLVWNYFTILRNGGKARCNLCKKEELLSVRMQLANKFTIINHFV